MISSVYIWIIGITSKEKKMSIIKYSATAVMIFVSIVSLSGCAAIQGARGDAASAKELADANAKNTTGIVLNTQTIAPPTQPQTSEQSAVTNAAKMIAPVR